MYIIKLYNYFAKIKISHKNVGNGHSRSLQWHSHNDKGLQNSQIYAIVKVTKPKEMRLSL